MAAEQRGLDPAAIPTTPEETESFESAVVNVEIESLKRSLLAIRKSTHVSGPKHAVAAMKCLITSLESMPGCKRR